MKKEQYHRTILINNYKVYLPQRSTIPAYDEEYNEIPYSLVLEFTSWKEVEEFQEALLTTKDV